ncbi:MAG: hypothetical protein R3C44_18590 [Chloroflexota bacterium]
MAGYDKDLATDLFGSARGQSDGAQSSLIVEDALATNRSSNYVTG